MKDKPMTATEIEERGKQFNKDCDEKFQPIIDKIFGELNAKLENILEEMNA